MMEPKGPVGGTDYPRTFVVTNPVSYRQIVSNRDHNM